VVLDGRTARGAPIELVFYDGKLHSVVTRTAVWCPQQRSWDSWRWSPADGAGAPFRRDGSRFHVRERWEFPEHRPPMIQVSALRGRLDEDGESARGSIEGRWFWEEFVCEASVRFSARRTP
jgi:hypothetical protein